AYAAVGAEGEALTLAASFPRARDGLLSNAPALHSDAAAVYAEVWSSKAGLARVYERRALAARAAAADPRAAGLLARLTAVRRPAVRGARAALRPAPRPAARAALRKRDGDLADQARQIAALDRELRPLLPAVGRAEKLARATPADLQKALPPDAAVVDFLRYT